MARRDRRSWGRRELKRATDEKTMRFFELHDQGFGREAIAAKLQFTLEQADELMRVMEEQGDEDETVREGVGGQHDMQGH